MFWFNGMHGNMMFGMFAGWIIILIIGFLLINSYINGNSKTSNKRHLEILKERLVKGEITEEEYDKLKEKIL